jgi:fatty-acyl-CoA synthase
MFISGGENVYPAEVEAAILQHPAVAHAAVIGIPDDRWGEVGWAWVEPRPGAQVDAGELLGFLGPRLARYKQPKRIVVDTIPRTASGKLDKIALRPEALRHPPPASEAGLHHGATVEPGGSARRD